ncbi:sensor histidine kinase [Leptodesmis sichuanensis]|uniref:sensor histidine kinase n=1 Tax=Leptodesmis sichuanensis TaxID=2906798 RepID=UPI001F29BF18|nr:sensor histidine kinase [Leptodesmis sichuanensis]UIE36462.1 sensor histidine kinase [Leptodesmis sichuanensis A121]
MFQDSFAIANGMLMPASSEFVALCRAQIGILTQALGASIAVVYLTQELVEGSQAPLVPVVVYPEGGLGRDAYQGVSLPPVTLPKDEIAQLPANAQPPAPSPKPSALTPKPLLPEGNRALPSAQSNPEIDLPNLVLPGKALVEQRQIALPLVHEEIMMGVLVARRDDRAWQKREQEQIEEIAKTLSIACVMDQRYQWLAQEHQQEHLMQRQQHDLMDNLLHQFRNSLTALQTFGKLILKRLQPGNPNRDIAVNLTRETERLRELSQQLEFVLKAGYSPALLPPASLSLEQPADLGNAALEAPLPASLQNTGFLPGRPLPVERCLVEDILEPLLSATQTIAQEKSLSLHAILSDDLPPVWANPQALREVLNNLLENAVKYTPAGGLILVQTEATETQPWFTISVTDTGPGIPEQDLPHIFERHFRGVQAQGEIAGSGLGLAIAQTLVTQMHGTIQVFSPALPEYLNLPGTVLPSDRGQGTSFVVKLPVALEGE